jgi:hypothetical protein
MNALEELMYNPIGSKWLWALGIGAGALAVGATAYAATRSTAQTAAQPGTSTPGNPLTDGPTQQAVATIVLGFENGTGTAIDLCSSGSAAVMAFQNAWNAAAQGNSQYQQLPTTGLYDQATATAAQQVNGNAPSFPNCAATSTTSGS